MVLETKNLPCLMEAGTSSFTIFGNEVEEIYRAKTETPIILYTKFGLHNIPVLSKIFPLLTCI